MTVIERASIAVTPEAEREPLQRIPVEIDERIPVEVDKGYYLVRGNIRPTGRATAGAATYLPPC